MIHAIPLSIGMWIQVKRWVLFVKLALRKRRTRAFKIAMLKQNDALIVLIIEQNIGMEIRAIKLELESFAASAFTMRSLNRSMLRQYP